MVDVPHNINVIEPFLQKLIKEYASQEVNASHNSDWEMVKDTLVKYLKIADGVVFAELFKKLSYQGSTYENLKIGPRNEYDINLELRLSDYYELEVEEGANPGFAVVKVVSVRRKRPSEEVMKKVEGWLDDQRYLCTNKILNWFKGIVDNALTAMEQTTDGIKICRRESGPAITLYIDYGREFSVDLVLALPFATDQMPTKQKQILQKAMENSSQSSSIDQYMENQVWYLIPKKPSLLNFYEWRMSFYLYEKKIMKGLYGMKVVIKILKALRDRRKWNPLSSYYIKTVFLWELEGNEPGFWSNHSVSYLFYHMLNKLVVCLDNKSIEYFWNENCNLVKDLDEDFLTNVKWFIFHRIKKLDRALSGQFDPRDVLEEMFSHESAPEPVCTSGEMNRNEQKGIGSIVFEGLSNAFSDFLLSESSGNEAAGVTPQGANQSGGFVNFLGKIGKQIENSLTPWKRVGIEENEGLIEGLDNGYSEPTNEHARKRQDGSWLKWSFLGAALAVGIAAAMRNNNNRPTTTTTTTNSTTTTSNTTSSVRRFQS